MHLCAEAEHKHVGNILCVVHFLELLLQLGLQEQACTDSVRTQTVRYQSTSPRAGHTLLSKEQPYRTGCENSEHRRMCLSWCHRRRTRAIAWLLTFGTFARPGCSTSITCDPATTSSCCTIDVRVLPACRLQDDSRTKPGHAQTKSCKWYNNVWATHKLLARQQLVGHKFPGPDCAGLLPHFAGLLRRPHNPAATKNEV